MSDTTNTNNTTNKSPTIFEEWVEIECADCERWWLNQCDGCKDSVKGSKTPCNSFLATRQVKIPQEIKELKRDIIWLKIHLAILSGCVALLAIANLV